MLMYEREDSGEHVIDEKTDEDQPSSCAASADKSAPLPLALAQVREDNERRQLQLHVFSKAHLRFAMRLLLEQARRTGSLTLVRPGAV